MIRVSAAPIDGGGVYDGGDTLTEARRRGKEFLKHSPRADIAIVKSAPYHKTKNPYEERLLIVEEIQSPPIGGYRDPGSRRDLLASRDARPGSRRDLLASHRGYTLRSGRRILGSIKPTKTRDVYLWSSNFTKDRGVTTGLDSAIRILLKQSSISLRQYEVDLVDAETGKRRSISSSGPISRRDPENVDYVLVYGGRTGKGFAVSKPFILKSMAIAEAKALSRPDSYGDEVRVGMRKGGRVLPVGVAKNGVFRTSK